MEWWIMNSFLRKRFLNFLTNFDLIDMSAKTLYSVLTSNLRNMESIVYVYQSNAPSWREEVQFICGSQDMCQWNVSFNII